MIFQLQTTTGWRVIILEDHAQLSFSSQLTLEEIERNFADVDLYEGLIAALSEALEFEERSKR